MPGSGGGGPRPGRSGPQPEPTLLPASVLAAWTLRQGAHPLGITGALTPPGWPVCRPSVSAARRFSQNRRLCVWQPSVCLWSCLCGDGKFPSQRAASPVPAWRLRAEGGPPLRVVLSFPPGSWAKQLARGTSLTCETQGFSAGTRRLLRLQSWESSPQVATQIGARLGGEWETTLARKLAGSITNQVLTGGKRSLFLSHIHVSLSPSPSLSITKRKASKASLGAPWVSRELDHPSAASVSHNRVRGQLPASAGWPQCVQNAVCGCSAAR